MTDDTEVFIRKARTAIEAKGWAIYETRIKPTPEGNCLLELFKAGNRMAWGVDDRLMCWTEAYQKVTGSERSVTQRA
jgi:hypothetical protein